jgi:signal transduction histidine kinase
MTASYMLVTAGAVILAEAVIIAVILPMALAAADGATRVRNTANQYAKATSIMVGSGGQLPATSAELQGTIESLRSATAAAGRKPGAAEKPVTKPPADDDTVLIKPITTARPANEAVPFVILIDTKGRVRASSDPVRYPSGADAGLPVSDAAALRGIQEGELRTAAGKELWAVAPIIDATVGTPAEDGLGAAAKAQAGAAGGVDPSVLKGLVARKGKGTVVGAIYVQVPEGAAKDPAGLGAIRSVLERAEPALEAGLLMLLVVVVPAGVVFGLLTTRQLTRRLQRLATATVEVAEGDLTRTVPVTGADEVAQLERGFNRMAGQLATGIAVERQLAGANARLAERARIARELHDAISQSLFSLGMQAGGLRRALSQDSALAGQVHAMESTVTRMTQEMQALLLELRPVALEEAGLVPALEELCRAYSNRLGVTVDAFLDPVELPAPVEHTILRLAQEALTNAVRHADAARVTLRLGESNGAVEVTVTDDGCGFDPAAAGTRRGIGLASMRERVEELGGIFDLRAATGHGTTVRALIPREQA